MANPQAENGHIRIATEIFEALARIRIPGEAMQILITIVRKTYGFNKKEDAISLSQFVLATGLKKPNVIRSLKLLISINIIIKKDNGIIGIYLLNKDFDTWKPLSKKITAPKSLSKKITGVIEKDNDSLSKKIPTIRQRTINTITKDSVAKSPTPSELAKDFFAMVENQIDPYENFILTTADVKNLDYEIVRAEIDKFYNYWCELSLDGKKQRWQNEKTFEVKRRLDTWFSRIQKFSGKDNSKSFSFIS